MPVEIGRDALEPASAVEHRTALPHPVVGRAHHRHVAVMPRAVHPCADHLAERHRILPCSSAATIGRAAGTVQRCMQATGPCDERSCPTRRHRRQRSRTTGLDLVKAVSSKRSVPCGTEPQGRAASGVLTCRGRGSRTGCRTCRVRRAPAVRCKLFRLVRDHGTGRPSRPSPTSAGSAAAAGKSVHGEGSLASHPNRRSATACTCISRVPLRPCRAVAPAGAGNCAGRQRDAPVAPIARGSGDRP